MTEDEGTDWGEIITDSEAAFCRPLLNQIAARTAELLAMLPEPEAAASAEPSAEEKQKMLSQWETPQPA